MTNNFLKLGQSHRFETCQKHHKQDHTQRGKQVGGEIIVLMVLTFSMNVEKIFTVNRGGLHRNGLRRNKYRVNRFEQNIWFRGV